LWRKHKSGLTVPAARHDNRSMKITALFSVAIGIFFTHQAIAQVADLPPEMPLWAEAAARNTIRYDIDEQVRSETPPPGSLSRSNRVFSYVSTPTYSIHRPANPNGVGLVICPGGGYRDVWLDREGHDLAIRLKDHGVTSLVLKYRTNSGRGNQRAYSWDDYLPAVMSDARQAIRILRGDADRLRLDSSKIGICGFSAGGNLALIASLYEESEPAAGSVDGMPDFTGLFYPWFREDYSQIIELRTDPNYLGRHLCPMFIMNAGDDHMTPAAKCVDFYTRLLEAKIKAELHVFSKGSHGFDLGTGRGESAALWPESFMAWMHDIGLIE